MKNSEAVVAAGHRLTAEAAAEILTDGGNAFDAAIAGIWMSFVAEPIFASLGGGGFLMARRAERGDAKLFDFFVQTPLKRRRESEVSFYPIEADFGPATQQFHIGLGASAAPGVAQGLFTMHEAYGSLPMKRLVEPAVRAAKQGFPVSPFQAYLFQVVSPILTNSSGARAIFAPEGDLLKEGEVFKNEAMAETMEWLAEDGPLVFTEGDIGDDIAAQSHEQGGHLKIEDLQRYKVVLRDPLNWRYGKSLVALNPPPSAGGALIAYGLAYLEALKDLRRPINAASLGEAMIATNKARATHGKNLGSFLQRGLLQKEIAAAVEGPNAYQGTTHLSVIDGKGNTAAVTLSNGEGNGFIVGPHGFMMNNMLGEEDVADGEPGQWPLDTRMSSMMAPTIVLEENGTVTALGSGGSNRIRTAVLQVIVNLLDRRMESTDAVDAPRLHVERGGRASYEPGFSEEDEVAIRALTDEPHAWPDKNLFFGGVQVARWGATTGAEGAGDGRRFGAAIVV